MPPTGGVAAGLAMGVSGSDDLGSGGSCVTLAGGGGT